MPSRIRPCRCRVNDFGADGVWARHEANSSNGVDWFYTFDPQGCLSQKVGRDGSVLCSSIYDAQGHEATTDTHPDPFSGYGGQWDYYADWETSTTGGGSCLYLLGHRFYDPDAGRFLNRDPIGYAGGINLYAYTGNDPVNRADPSGFSSLLFTCGGVAGGGVYGAGGGYSGSVGTGVDTSGNIGVVTQGAVYGLGASGGPGGIVEQSGPGVTFSTGDLNNGFEPTVNSTNTFGPVTVDIEHPVTGEGTTVAVTVGEGEGVFSGVGVGGKQTTSGNVGTFLGGIIDGIVKGVYNQIGLNPR